jgi:ribosomal protein L37AE/L43A
MEFTENFICEECGKPGHKKLLRLIPAYERCGRILCKGCYLKWSLKQKYGVTDIHKIPGVKEKVTKTMNEKFGADSFMESPFFLEKAKKTWLKKYGTENPTKTESVKQKYRDNMQEKYGVDNAFQAEEVKTKIKETWLKKYGVDNPAKNPEIHQKDIGFRKPLYEGQRFDSTWELAYWIWCKDHNIKIERCKDCFTLPSGKVYFPDFIVDNRIIEIKSDYILSMMTDSEKLKCIESNNIELISDFEIRKYLDYIRKTYGKKYLQSFYTSKQKEKLNES